MKMRSNGQNARNQLERNEPIVNASPTSTGVWSICYPLFGSSFALTRRRGFSGSRPTVARHENERNEPNSSITPCPDSTCATRGVGLPPGTLQPGTIRPVQSEAPQGCATTRADDEKSVAGRNLVVEHGAFHPRPIQCRP